MRIKIFLLLVCLFGLAGIFLFVNRQCDYQALRIGFVCALTGDASGTGRPIANAIDYFREEFPDAKFFVEDSKSTPIGGVQAAHKLIDINHVNVVFCEMSNVSAAIADYTDRNKVIFIAPIILKDFVTKYRYTVRDFMTLDEQVEVDILEYERIGGRVGGNLVAIVSNDEFGRSSFDGLTVALSKSQLNLVADFRFDSDNNQFKSIVANVMKKAPDVIFASSFSPSLGVIVKELRTAGYTGYILTTTAFTAPSIQMAAGDGLWGIIHPDFVPTETFAALNSWYERRFHDKAPLTLFLCHDGLAVMMDAYRASGRKKAASAILDNLVNVSLDNGAYGSLHVKDREIKFQLTAKTIDRR